MRPRDITIKTVLTGWIVKVGWSVHPSLRWTPTGAISLGPMAPTPWFARPSWRWIQNCPCHTSTAHACKMRQPGLEL